MNCCSALVQLQVPDPCFGISAGGAAGFSAGLGASAASTGANANVGAGAGAGTPISFVSVLCDLMRHPHANVQSNAVGMIALLAAGDSSGSSGSYGGGAGDSAKPEGVSAHEQRVLSAAISSRGGLQSLVLLAQAAQDEQVVYSCTCSSIGICGWYWNNDFCLFANM